jgi:hypothetical protein
MTARELSRASLSTHRRASVPTVDAAAAAPTATKGRTTARGGKTGRVKRPRQSESKTCRACGEVGHFQRSCPNAARRSDVASPHTINTCDNEVASSQSDVSVDTDNTQQGVERADSSSTSPDATLNGEDTGTPMSIDIDAGGSVHANVDRESEVERMVRSYVAPSWDRESEVERMVRSYVAPSWTSPNRTPDPSDTHSEASSSMGVGAGNASPSQAPADDAHLGGTSDSTHDVVAHVLNKSELAGNTECAHGREVVDDFGRHGVNQNHDEGYVDAQTHVRAEAHAQIHVHTQAQGNVRGVDHRGDGGDGGRSPSSANSSASIKNVAPPANASTDAPPQSPPQTPPQTRGTNQKYPSTEYSTFLPSAFPSLAEALNTPSRKARRGRHC